MKIQYTNIRSLNPIDGDRYIQKMQSLAKWISPLGRTRGLRLISNLYRRRLTTIPFTIVDLSPNTKFCFPTFDSYWGYYIYRNKPYEQALETLFLNLKNIPFTFLDCGANYGYWSALLSSPTLGEHPVIAIEASLETFDTLKKTSAINQNRFQFLHRAISNIDNKILQFTESGAHAGRHIVDGFIEKLKVNDSLFTIDKQKTVTVNSITLDTLATTYAPKENSFVVKLDVEGAELDAFIGATEISNKDTIFLYEDYGGDKDSEVSKKLLSSRYEIYFPNDDGTIIRIRDLRMIEKIKKNSRLGYNFIALKGNGPLSAKIRGLQKSPKLKVLHITTGLETGGTEMMIYKVASMLDKNKFDNAVLCFKPPGTLSTKFRDKNIQFLSLKIDHPFQFFFAIFRFRKIIKDLNPDIIQGWLVHGNIAALLAKLFFRKINVYWNIRHTLIGIEREKLHTRFLIFISKMLSYKTKKIIYNSKTSQSQHEAFGYKNSLGVLIPNGFDTNLFRPDDHARTETLNDLKLPQNAFLIGIIARYHPVKGHRVFIEAAKQLLDDGYRAYFVMVGNKVTSCNPNLKKLISEARYKEHFLLLGERKDVHRIVASLDVATLSSSWGEAFPNVLGEAMSSGIICVSTDVGDCKRILGGTGFVVKPNSAEHLKEAWVKILNMNSENIINLKNDTRQRVIDEFSMEKIIKYYEDIYLYD